MTGTNFSSLFAVNRKRREQKKKKKGKEKKALL